MVVGLIALGLSTEDDDAKDRPRPPRRRPAQTKRRPSGRGEEAPEQPAAPTRVALRIAPELPTYACVDRGTEPR